MKNYLAVNFIICLLNLNTVLRTHILFEILLVHFANRPLLISSIQPPLLFRFTLPKFSFVLCYCSEVLPAVLNSEMSVSVLEWSLILVSV